MVGLNKTSGGALYAPYMVGPAWQAERDFLDGKISGEAYEKTRRDRDGAKVFFCRLAELIYSVKLEPLGW